MVNEDLANYLQQPTDPAPSYIYLASPYFHANPEVMAARRAAVTRYAADMVNRGLVPFSPIAYTNIFEQLNVRPPGGWYSFDLAWLKPARELYMLALPGWEQSSGMLLERSYAQAAQIPHRIVRYGEVIPLLEPETRRTLNLA